MTARLVRVGTTAALLLTLGLTSACGAEELDCDWMANRDLTGAGRTVFLVDVSGSTRSTGEAPDYPVALDPWLRAAVARGDAVSIGSFDGSATTVRWTTERQLTRSDRNRPSRQEDEEKDAPGCLDRHLRAAAGTAARTDRTDILGAIGVAGKQTGPAAGAPDGAAGQAGSEGGPGGTATPARRTVVLATDGLGTTGCADLSARPAGDPGITTAMARACPGEADWPKELAGAELVMVGVGQPAQGQPILTTAALGWLQRHWERLCALTGAVSCEISTAPVPARTGGGPAGPGPEPVVTFAAGTSAPPPDPKRTFNLSAEVLFDTASDKVRPAGVAQLLALEIEPGATITVTGHTDSRGDRAYNQDLSQRRAEAVASVLRTRHDGQIRSAGAGETDLLCPGEQNASGAWDQECLQRNRRVQIAITKGSG
ncbi:OOP family OmpA-OmpF porin [Micromonospora pisi]|uniref:OOP family OmpA-OmpF porin n=1 Tax=Micromonospora pisi TaxID=589240 RepID=A0A495JGT2_9ACTN|nr:OmpA family protein [Micromonospora pisi]RKR87249.1 OOP family OmpA-OmpF porin [Micromonospora pisi]